MQVVDTLRFLQPGVRLNDLNAGGGTAMQGDGPFRGIDAGGLHAGGFGIYRPAQQLTDAGGQGAARG